MFFSLLFFRSSISEEGVISTVLLGDFSETADNGKTNSTISNSNLLFSTGVSQPALISI